MVPKDGTDVKPQEQLRSDAFPFPLSKTKQSGKKGLAFIIGAVVVLVVLIVVVASFTGILAKKNSSTTTNGNGGIFGQLQATATPINNQVSGLSGMPCEHPNRRTIGVMVAGDPINRPISGFSQADMVLEMPVLVSDVTRLTAYYQCGEPKEIGSVRSARHDYLFMAEGFDVILGHWGGSYHVLNRIAAGEFQTINALQNPFNTYFRKDTLPAPYNGFTSYENLWNALQKLGYRTTTNFKGYDFKDDAATSERPGGGTLTIAWPGAFRVSYEYDQATNRYVRLWAGVKQIDPANNNVTVAPSAVAIVRATNGLADGPGGYNDMGIEGTGVLDVYQDGKVIHGTWKKNELDKKDPMHFMNDKGEPIVFTRGQVWVTAVEPSVTVTWQDNSTTPSSTSAQ